jgi:hypothetical protein
MLHAGGEKFGWLHENAGLEKRIVTTAFTGMVAAVYSVVTL